MTDRGTRAPANRPISDGTLNGALRRLGVSAYEHAPHGFRATARTIMAELGMADSDVVEMQLAHSKGPYNRADYLPQRIALMQAWGDYLDKLRTEPTRGTQEPAQQPQLPGGE